MTKTANRFPRPSYTDGFKKGAVELFHARKRENAQESDYACTRAVAAMLEVSFMSIRNWVRQAEAKNAAESAQSGDGAATSVAGSPTPSLLTGDVQDSPTATVHALTVVRETQPEDPEATILALRAEVAELRRANKLLKTTTAYLASESLKVA